MSRRYAVPDGELGNRVTHTTRRGFLGTAASTLVVAGLSPALRSMGTGLMQIPDQVRGVRALTFDVFGTVVDWRSSIIREGEELGRRKQLTADWPAFADAWRNGYGPAMRRVRSGDLPWTIIDDLHRMILDSLVPQFGLDGLSGAELDELNRAWHRLDPWPDAVEGLTRLRTRFVLATLSNGNLSLLVNMAKHARLPWDAVLSAELAGTYKPDLRVYAKAADLLGLAPQEVMMVAAHVGDLRASAEVGFRTAYVPRPQEHGPGREPEPADPSFDIVASDFVDLAAQLGT